MTVAEQYAPVTHNHDSCPVCNHPSVIQDVARPQTTMDKLLVDIRNNNAWFRIFQGKRIEVKEMK